MKNLSTFVGKSSHLTSNLISRTSTATSQGLVKQPTLQSLGSITHEHTTEMNTPRERSEERDESSVSANIASAPAHMIGPLTSQERIEKVLRYLDKKRNKSNMKKFCYKCRKQVAEKRLRIKGRFVTRQQAFEILGITYDELKSNEIIQRLLESHAAFLDANPGSVMNHPLMI